MRSAQTYYFIVKSIESCRTTAQVEACERLINNIRFLFAPTLARMALLKKCELLTKQYPVEE